MLYLVGETKDFDARRAHFAAHPERGHLVRLGRGIYCDRGDQADLPGFMKKNAIRLANYLNPHAALSAFSAFHKGALEVAPGPNGERKSRLFIAGTRTKTYKLPHLEIVQFPLLKNEAYFQFCRPYRDGRELEMGEMDLGCLSEEVVFLENFSRRRYHTERFLSPRAMVELRKILEERHGAGLGDHLCAVARQCGDLGLELDRALRALRRPVEEPAELPPAVASFAVGWHTRRIGQITFDGTTWKFGYEKGWLLPLMGSGFRPGVVPAYVSNMLPEGFASEAISAIHVDTGAKQSLMDASDRYLSSIVMASDAKRLVTLPVDRLYGRLATYRRDSTFTGAVSGVPMVEGTSLTELRELVARLSMPRLPGFQAKLPMHLDDRGVLTPADGKPFTHILKFAGIANDPLCARSAVEWACLDLAKAGGLTTAESAMVGLPDGTIGLLSERFDIQRDEDDYRMLACEDLCAVFGLHPNAKYYRSCEEVGGKLREVSTSFVQDAQDFFRQVCVNLYVENGDFHLKNLSVLKVADPMLVDFRSVRLSPVYDVLSTRPFSHHLIEQEEWERMALKINGKDSDLGLDDLLALGNSLDIPSDQALDIARDAAAGVARRASEIRSDPPALLATMPTVVAVVSECCTRTLEYIAQMFPDIDCQVGQAAEPSLARRRRGQP